MENRNINNMNEKNMVGIIFFKPDMNNLRDK